MYENHLYYLRREHARLEAEIRKEARRPYTDDVLVARLKKLKLAIKDQIAASRSDLGDSQAA